ncbi:hypothetical protein ACH4T9_29390 [Micromonospora sp. NPDC020750]
MTADKRHLNARKPTGSTRSMETGVVKAWMVALRALHQGFLIGCRNVD